MPGAGHRSAFGRFPDRAFCYALEESETGERGTPNNPLPDRVIRKIVTARVAANAGKTRASKATVIEASGEGGV